MGKRSGAQRGLRPKRLPPGMSGTGSHLASSCSPSEAVVSATSNPVGDVMLEGGYRVTDWEPGPLCPSPRLCSLPPLPSPDGFVSCVPSALSVLVPDPGVSVCSPGVRGGHNLCRTPVSRPTVIPSHGQGAGDILPRRVPPRLRS